MYMTRTFILNNRQREQMIVSKQPLQQVYLESFHYNEGNRDDQPSFVVDWRLNGSGKTISQYYNFSLTPNSPTVKLQKQQDLLRRLGSCYATTEPFYTFVLKLGRPFRSDEHALYITLAIPE